MIDGWLYWDTAGSFRCLEMHRVLYSGIRFPRLSATIANGPKERNGGIAWKDENEGQSCRKTRWLIPRWTKVPRMVGVERVSGATYQQDQMSVYLTSKFWSRSFSLQK